jgi:hypothetical protein
MVSSRDYLQSQSKIILGHHPIYSEWIGIELLAVLKPSIKLHELNISNRTPELKRIALRNWIDLTNAVMYDDWESFNKLIFKYVPARNPGEIEPPPSGLHRRKRKSDVKEKVRRERR